MSRFVILLYHGVTRQTHRGIENCSRKHIQEADFLKQMEYLKKAYHPLPLREAIRLAQAGNLPDRSVAVTFDDGFENNYSVAFPILRSTGVPATFFLSSGHIGTSRVFWVDKVEYLINETGRTELLLPALEENYSLGTLEQRKSALRRIKTTLKQNPELIAAVLGELEERLEVAARYDYPDYRTLSWEQVRRMRASGLCDFGGHSVDHAILSKLSLEEQALQIQTCKQDLETRLAEPVDLFSYPEGQQEHFNEETIGLVRKAGFSASCTALFGLNTAETSPFHLRRNMVEFTAPFKECLEPLHAACR